MLIGRSHTCSDDIWSSIVSCLLFHLCFRRCFVVLCRGYASVVAYLPLFIAMAGRFSQVQQAAPIEVFAVVKAFNEDTHEKKVNLSIGGGLSFE